MRLNAFGRRGILFSFVLTLVSACGGSAVVTQDKPTPSGPELTEAVGGGVVGAAPETSGEAAKSSETVKLVSDDIAQYFQSIDADPAESFPIEISDFYLAEDSKIIPDGLDILEWTLHQDGALLSADDKLIVKGFSAVLKLKSTSTCGRLRVDHLLLIFCPGSIDVSMGEEPERAHPGVSAVVRASGQDSAGSPTVVVKGVPLSIGVQTASAVEAILAVVVKPDVLDLVAPVVLLALLEKLPAGFSQARSAISAVAAHVAVALGSSASGGSKGTTSVASGVSNLTISGLTLEGTYPISGLSGLTNPSIGTGLALPSNKLLFFLRTNTSSSLVVLDTQSLTAVLTDLALADFNVPTDAQNPFVFVSGFSGIGANKIAALIRVEYSVSGGSSVKTNVLVTYTIDPVTGALSSRYEVGRFTEAELTNLTVGIGTNTAQLYEAWPLELVCTAVYCDIFLWASRRTSVYQGPENLGARIVLASGQISSRYSFSIPGRVLSFGNAVRGPLSGTQAGNFEFLGNETPTGGTNTPAIISFQLDSSGQLQNLTSVPITMPSLEANTRIQNSGFVYRYVNGLFFDDMEIVEHSRKRWVAATATVAAHYEGVDDYTVRSIVGTLTAESPHVLTVAGTYEHAAHIENPQPVVQFQVFGWDGNLYTFVQQTSGTIELKRFRVN